MERDAELLTCRVCGLMQADFTWGNDGATPSHNICSCCGVEFGYEDCLPESIRKYRSGWLSAGAKWTWPKDKPAGWQLELQLAQIPTKFL